MRTFPGFLGLLFFAIIRVSAIAESLEEGTQAFRQNDFVRALLLLQPLADAGNARAQAIIGNLFVLGCCGVAEDAETGLEWLRKAAAQGDAEAESLLGDAYLAGRGTQKDYAQAMSWLLKAAEKGDASAQTSIAKMFEEGLGVPKNQEEAKKWSAKARRQPALPKDVVDGLASTSQVTLLSLQPWGGPDVPPWQFHAHHVLGRVELTGEQAKKAIRALNAAVSGGDANLFSMCLINPRHALVFKAGGDTYDLLICYECGQLEVYKNDQRLRFDGSIGGGPALLNGMLKAAGTPLADDAAALRKSYAEEAKAALKLAEEGDTKAQDVIARMFMQGRGVRKDEAKGIEWLAKSLQTSSDQADFQVTIGKLYSADTDQYVKHDYAKAMKLFQQAAAKGNAEAEYQIGFMHEFGQGVPRNQTEAIKWCRQSAEHGFAEAQFSIGVSYAQGRDMKQDYAQALQWLQKAAEQVHPQALAWLGTMYEKGWGVPQNQMEAYFWDQLAVKSHTIYGNRIPFRPTPEQYALLEKRVADWIAAHPTPWERSP